MGPGGRLGGGLSPGECFLGVWGSCHLEWGHQDKEMGPHVVGKGECSSAWGSLCWEKRQSPAALMQEDLEGSLEPHKLHSGRFCFARITPPAPSQAL